MRPNPTDAKDIALYFIGKCNLKPTTPIIRKSIGQAKMLLSSGYTKEQIISVIDYLINKGIKMYSFGYICSSIADVLQSIELITQAAEEKAKLNSALRQQSEVMSYSESTERNRNKLNGFGVQSRFGKKYSFDLFEE